MTTPHTLMTHDLTATISPLGARLDALHYRGGPNLVLFSDNPAWRDCYGGVIVGPVANRVTGGRAPVGDATHQMPCNENGVTALHSGPDGLDRQMWRAISATETTLHLRCTLADGHGGLPGSRIFDVTYALDGTALSLDIRAETDALTPIAIAHHPYWRLGEGQRLMVNAARYLPRDARNLPTGEIAPVAGTALDHRTPAPVHPDTDHNFCISQHRTPAPREVAVLTSDAGMQLAIHSTEPGLQVYAGGFLPDLPGDGIAPGAGLALEPQGWPDALNQPAFPPILIGPDAPYHQITRYHISGST